MSCTPGALLAGEDPGEVRPVVGAGTTIPLALGLSVGMPSPCITGGVLLVVPAQPSSNLNKHVAFPGFVHLEGVGAHPEESRTGVFLRYRWGATLGWGQQGNVADRRVPKDGEFTVVDETLEPGSKGLRDGETSPGDGRAAAGVGATAARLYWLTVGPGAEALGDGAWMTLGADCWANVGLIGLAGAGAGAIAGTPGLTVTVEALPGGLGVVVTLEMGGGGTPAGPATAGAVSAFVPVMKEPPA